MAEIAPDRADGRRLARDFAILVAVVLAATLARYAVYRLAIGDGTISDFVTALCRLDCLQYLDVWRGYDVPPATSRTGGADWAFFPLAPLLIGTVGMLTGLDWPQAGFIASSACGIAAALVARPLLRDERAYWLFAVGLLAGPFSLHFSLGYSEAPFILLTLLALRALQRSNYVAAGAWGALLSATRVTGVLIGLSLLAQAIADRLRDGTRPGALPLALLTDRRLLLGALLVPLGLIGFMLFLRLHVGDGLALLHAQIGWQRDIGNPLEIWWRALQRGWPFGAGFSDDTAVAWVVLIAAALSVALAATRRWAAAVFCLAVLLVSLSAGMQSMLRFTTGLAPLGLVVAAGFARWRWSTALGHLLGIAGGLCITTAWLLGWDLLT